VRVELEKHLGAGEEMPREHIRMLARLLSHNADLMDQEWADDQQSHWNISAETKKETRVSFFVPCLRPRFEYVFDYDFFVGDLKASQCRGRNRNRKESGPTHKVRELRKGR
jgi:hypothetical protein